MQNVDRLALGKQYYELHKSGGGTLDWQQIATQSGTTYNIIREAARYYKRSLPADMPVPPDTHLVPRPSPAPHSTDEQRELLRAYLGTTLSLPEAKTRKPSERRKVVCCADLHGHPSKDVLHAIIAQQPDMIVIAGDLLDSAQGSPWGKAPGESDKSVTFRQEMSNVRAWIETLLLNTKADVSILSGNHDRWAAKRAAELLPPYLLEFFHDPFDVLIAELPQSRIHRVRTVFEYMHPDHSRSELGQSEFMYVLGDALISHANFVGSNAGDAVRKLCEKMNQWKHTLGLNDIRVFVQAHVHNVCLIEQDAGNRILVEPGAACDPSVESYKVGYKLGTWRPMGLGCVVFEQYKNDTWQTDLSSVQLIRPRRSAH